MVLQAVFAAFVFWMSTSGCGGTEFAMVSDGGQLPWTVVSAPPTTPCAGWCAFPSRRAVITNDAEWQASWAQFTACRTPAAPIPTVDFTREMIVLVSVGERPTGGYAVSIDSAMIDSDGVLRVHATELRPGARCFVTTAITYPAALARVPRRSAPLAIEVAVVTKDCG